MGCARNTLAGIGCVSLVALATIAVYQYRAPLAGVVRGVTGGRGASRDTIRAVGRPSSAALRNARRKETAMERPDGPDSVTVTADEMAALVEAGLDPLARSALDSLRVTLAPGRFTLDARVVTTRLGRDVLGPIAGMLDEREPLRMSGPATVAEPGRVSWIPDQVRVRAFHFPASLIPRMVDAVTGGRDGVVPIVVPKTVGRVDIRGDGVIFYRRAE